MEEQLLEYDFNGETSAKELKEQKKTAKAERRTERKKARLQRKIQKISNRLQNVEDRSEESEEKESTVEVETKEVETPVVTESPEEINKKLEKANKKITKKINKLHHKEEKIEKKREGIQMKEDAFAEMNAMNLRIAKDSYAGDMNKLAKYLVRFKESREFANIDEFVDYANQLAIEEKNLVSYICEKLDIDPNEKMFNSLEDVDNFINPRIVGEQFYHNCDVRIAGEDEEFVDFDDDLLDDVTTVEEKPSKPEPEKVKVEVTNEDPNNAIDVTAISFENIIEDDETSYKEIDPMIQKIENLVKRFVDKNSQVTASKTKYSNGENVGTYDVKVVDKSGTRVYGIDTGSIIPATPSVISYTNSGYTIAVPLVKRQKDLLKKIFNQVYMMSDAEFLELSKRYYLNDISLYNNIDFSGLTKLNGLSEAEKINFSNRIRFMIDSVHNSTGRNLRFRVNNFNSIDEFELVSDRNCVCPIPGVLATNDIGMCRIIYKNGSIEITTLDSTTTTSNGQMEIKDHRVA